MTITICDICGKQTEKSTEPLAVYKFAISSYGRVWDICDDCREGLNKWINIRKGEKSDNNDLVELVHQYLGERSEVRE